MKLSILILALVSSVAFLAGCEGEVKKTQQQQVSENLKEAVYPLTAEERQLAENNAKSFFNRDFPNGKDKDGNVIMTKGMWLDCRPSDSNANGLVTCHGMLPKMNGNFDDKAIRYCGYRPELVGCSDEDTNMQGKKLK